MLPDDGSAKHALGVNIIVESFCFPVGHIQKQTLIKQHYHSRTLSFVDTDNKSETFDI
jgi:hypothetical protein